MDDFLAGLYRECKKGRALVLADDLEVGINRGQLEIKPDSATVNVLGSLANLLRSAGEEFDSIETEGGSGDGTTETGKPIQTI